MFKEVGIIASVILITGCGVTPKMTEVPTSERNKPHEDTVLIVDGIPRTMADFIGTLDNVYSPEDLQKYFTKYIRVVPDNYPNEDEARDPYFIYNIGYGDHEDLALQAVKELRRLGLSPRTVRLADGKFCVLYNGGSMVEGRIVQIPAVYDSNIQAIKIKNER